MFTKPRKRAINASVAPTAAHAAQKTAAVAQTKQYNKKTYRDKTRRTKSKIKGKGALRFLNLKLLFVAGLFRKLQYN